jgi:hypothetical protein
MTVIAREDAPIEFSEGATDIRAVEAGDMTVAFERLEGGMRTDELFAGLPDDACQSPHWGYVTKGRFTVRYTSGEEETVEAGQAYHLPPGHNLTLDEDVEVVELSPTEARAATMEHAAKAFAASQG